MHRLRNRKKSGKEEKAKDDSATGNSSSSKSAFKRNKSQPPPTNRQQIDLTQALPSSDDFRTSLLMPNLEKRFSVLREQQEKEQQQKRNNAAAAAAAAGPGVNGIGYGALASGALSGLDDDDKGALYRPPYGNSGGLQDIAETASLSGSIQTGSARNSGSDDSFTGVMSRPRPAEGNVLFGGRQKVFKVSTVGTGLGDSAASPVSPREGRSYGGRALYSDDLPSGDRRGRGRYRDDEDERSVSPLGLYNRDRNTTSSTDSANPVSMSRTSTAATSVTSHSAQSVSSPAMSKPRRPLYAQALDNDLPLEDSFSDRKAEIIANANIKPRAMSPIPGMYPEEVYNRREFSPPAPLLKAGSNGRPLSPDDNRGRSLSPSNQNSRFHMPQTASIASNLSGPIRKQSTDDYSQPKKNDTASLASFDFGLGNNIGSNDDTNKINNTVTNNSGLPTPLSPDEEFHLGTQKPGLSGVSREPTPLPSPNPVPSPHKSDDYEDFKLRDDRSSYESNFIDPQFVSNHSAKPSVDQANQQSMYLDGRMSSASSNSSGGYKPAPLPKDITPSPLYKTEPQVHDSPTLPAQGGLSSMIRQHFRSASGASSIYPASILPKQTDDASWDTHEWENCEPEPEQEEAPKPKLTLAELKKRDAEERMMRNEPFELSRRQTTESERSNDEWENELAQRKRAVQMKLQGQLSGRNSPAPGHEMEVTRESPFKASTGLSGMLKSNKNGAPSGGDSKAMKMLGMSGPQPSGMKQLSRKASQEDYRQNMPMGGRMRAPSDPRPPHIQTRGPPGSQGGLAPGRMVAPPISPPADRQAGPPRKGPGHIPISALQQKFEEGSRRDDRRPGPGPGPGPGGPAPTPPHALPSPADRRRNRRPQGPQGVEDDLRPPHERPPHDRQLDPSRGRPLNGIPSRDQLREQPPRVGPGLPKGPKQPSPPRIPNGRKRSDEDFRPADKPAPLANTMSSDPMARRISPPKDDLREAMARGQSSAAVVDPVAEERSRLAAKKAAQQTLAPMENVQSRFSMEDPPVPKSFAGRVRSNSRAAKRPNDLEKEHAPPPPPIQTVPPPQLSVTTHGMYQMNSASNTSTTLASSALASPATTITTQSSGGGGNLTLADVTGISPGSSPGFQSAGPAFQSREGKKGKVRKMDISEPKLFHTTSTMPASNLMNAGPKAIAPPVVLSHERSSPPRPRRGTQGNGGRPMSNEEEKPSRPAYMGHRLKKSLSDSNGLAERAKVSIPHSNSHQNLQEVSHPSWPTFENTNMPGGMI